MKFLFSTHYMAFLLLTICLILILLILAGHLCQSRKKLNQMSQQQAELSSILDFNKQEITSSLLLQLCYGIDPTQDSLAKGLSFFHLEQWLEHVAIVLIQFPHSTKCLASFHKDAYQQLQNQVLQCCHASSDNLFSTFWLWENPETILGFVKISEQLSDSVRLLGINNLCANLQNAFTEICDKPPVIAVGSATSSKKQIPSSYNEATELLNHKVHNHLSTPYSYEVFQRTELQFDYNKQQLLARYIRLGKAQDAVSFLNSYFSVIHANPYTSVSYVREITEQILQLITSLSEEFPIVHANCSTMLSKAEHELETLTHVHDFGEFLIPLVQDICNSVLSVSANKGKMKIDNLINWISKNYNQDLSLERMATYIGCSPTYTSKLFKKETTYDIMTYLSMIRIQHAKELLVSTNMTLDEISASVGYNHLQTFIRNFKKLTGLTPTEYRSTCETTKKI